MLRIFSRPTVAPIASDNNAAAGANRPAAASSARDGLELPRAALESMVSHAGRARVPVSPEPPVASRVPGPAFRADERESHRDVPRGNRTQAPAIDQPPTAGRARVPVGQEPPPASRGRNPAGF